MFSALVALSVISVVWGACVSGGNVSGTIIPMAFGVDWTVVVTSGPNAEVRDFAELFPGSGLSCADVFPVPVGFFFGWSHGGVDGWGGNWSAHHEPRATNGSEPPCVLNCPVSDIVSGRIRLLRGASVMVSRLRGTERHRLSRFAGQWEDYDVLLNNFPSYVNLGWFDPFSTFFRGHEVWARVCTCNSTTEVCPSSTELATTDSLDTSVTYGTQLCPAGSFVIRTLSAFSGGDVPHRHVDFICVQFRVIPPTSAGQRSLVNDELIVAINDCWIAYDSGVAAFDDGGHLIALYLRTAACTREISWVACGPFLRNAFPILTTGYGTLVSADDASTTVLCDACAVNFGAIGTTRWCECCRADCQGFRASCEAEGWCQEGGYRCQACPVCAELPVACTPAPPVPTTTGRLVTPPPFGTPPCVAGSKDCSTVTSSPAPAQSPPPTPPPSARDTPCAYNRFTQRCTRADCPQHPLTHRCVLRVVENVATCECMQNRPCEWSDAEQRCVGGGGPETGSLCASDALPCFPLHLQNGRVSCNTTCSSELPSEKQPSLDMRISAIIARSRVGSAAQAISVVDVGVQSLLQFTDGNAASLAVVVDWRRVAEFSRGVAALPSLLNFRDHLLSASEAAVGASPAERLAIMDALWFKVVGGDFGGTDPCSPPKQSPASLWWQKNDKRNMVDAFDEWWSRAAAAASVKDGLGGVAPVMEIRIERASASTCRKLFPTFSLPVTPSGSAAMRRQSLAPDEACCSLDVAGGEVVTICINGTSGTSVIEIPLPREADAPTLLLCAGAGKNVNVSLSVQPVQAIVPILLRDGVPPFPKGLVQPDENRMVQDVQLPSDQTAAPQASLAAVAAVLGVALCILAMMLAVIIVLVTKNRRLRRSVSGAVVASSITSESLPAGVTPSRRRSRRSSKTKRTSN